MLSMRVGPGRNRTRCRLGLLHGRGTIPVAIPAINAMTRNCRIGSASTAPARLAIANHRRVVGSIARVRARPVSMSNTARAMRNGCGLMLPGKIGDGAAAMQIGMRVRGGMLGK